MIECLSVKENNEEALINKNGVVGVGTGYKWSNGVPTEQEAIIIFVEKKKSKQNILKKYSADDIIPSSLEGIPTDIIEVGKIIKHQFTQKVRPIKPGYSCGHRLTTAGTIGGIFIDKDGDVVILSNNHVLAAEDKATIGDVIYQPGPHDTNANLNYKDWPDPIQQLPYIATLKQFIALTHNNNQDSAIAKIHPKLIDKKLIDTIYPTINQSIKGFGNPEINQQVQKCGRTTGYTTGRTIALNAKFNINYDKGPITFTNCAVYTSMSKPGDSGSCIINMNMEVVSLLFAGSNKVTLANPIQQIQQTYGLQILGTTTNKPQTEEWITHTASGKITNENNTITTTAPANEFCYIEKPVKKFNTITLDVNTGTDEGATWGPGLTLQWPTGILKLNLRHGGQFGGYHGGNHNITIGTVKPNTTYKLRIRKTPTTYIGEIYDQKWYTVIELPKSVFPQTPIILKIGKTDMVGQATNHTTQGKTGTATYTNLTIE